MKTILYATDFSDHAEKALILALMMAQRHKASLQLVHVFDIPTSWEHPDTEDPLEMEKHARQAAEQKLRELLERQDEEKTNGVEVQFTALESTSPVKGITTLIKEQEPDLVVVGTRGGSPIRELIVGNTTRALIDKSPSPVLAVPGNAAERHLRHILYATDFVEGDIAAIQQLITLFQPFEPEINIVHVNRAGDYEGDEKFVWFKELVQEKVNYPNLSFSCILSEDVNEQLNEYIREKNVDLLVMLEKERHGLIDKLFHNDLIKRMEYHVIIPLLSINEHYV